MTAQKRQLRYGMGFFLLILCLCLFFVINVIVGSVKIPLSDIGQILLHHTDGAEESAIIWNIRLPRVFAVIFLGGALSVAGFLLQTFFGNPIAGPYVLGISSGAKLTVALTMVFLLSKGIRISSFGMILAAFVGSMLAMGFVLAVSTKVPNMSMLVICGVMIGYVCSAITEFVITFADDSNIINLHSWSQGSFSGMSWDKVKVMAFWVTLTMVFSFFLSKPISAYQMGESYAQSMGVNIRLLRVVLILLSSLLSACVTAFAGPISFVGIAVPHLMKSLFGTAKPILMIPACFLGGAVFCLFSDVLARWLFAPTEISISSITAVIGAPIVIYMMVHRRKRTGGMEA